MEDDSLKYFSLQNYVTLKAIKFYILNALNFILKKTLQYHGALSIIKTSVNFKGPLNHAISCRLFKGNFYGHYF